ncbi:MAG TPA: hypothetical protein VJI68_02380 [Candidatus Nanoarchaeia archaeon]|nr:hypothetical protein [Candidatus Nanoarchaeia archaeon]
MQSELEIRNLDKFLQVDRALVKPKKLADYDITSSFSHLTINLRSDEAFGYVKLDELERICGDRINLLPFNYDGTTPSGEKPKADVFETGFRLGQSDAGPRVLYEKDVPTLAQNFDRERILVELSKNWENIVNSNFSIDKSIKVEGEALGKIERKIVLDRCLELMNLIGETAEDSSDTVEFLQRTINRFLDLIGIKSRGIPESSKLDLFVDKLADDLNAGFPFWQMQLPDYVQRKHKSNEGTYLFYGVNSRKKLVPVKFYSNTDRFSFEMSNGEEITIPAEDSISAIEKRILFPTSTLLNYAALGPARKKKDNDRTVRIHIAGNFMAGQNGYAWPLIPYLNKTPGFDEVKLICAGHDERGTIYDRSTKPRKLISFGSMFMHFGNSGLEKCLKTGEPFSLDKGEIYHD